MEKKSYFSNNDDDLEILINLMSRLPGLGKRSARRAVLHMLERKEVLLEPIAKAFQNVNLKIQKCYSCGNISTMIECQICTNPDRDKKKLCIIADVSDLWAMERAKIFNGKYHVLGGLLSAINGLGPEELYLPKLFKKITNDGITEVILALNATIDGQTTAYYISDQLSKYDLDITTLAHGVPIGGELEYLDEGTLNIAFKSRKKLY
tara:strand:- start:181 stop:801 length:621 start_codon:yes stop_codon:yes gene_type:complete